MRRMSLLGALVGAALLVPAAASQAATLSYEGGAYVYRGEGSEGLSLLVSSYNPYGSQTTYLSFADSGADRQLDQSGMCTTDQYYDALLCPLDPNRPLKVYGSTGKDYVSIFSSSEVPDSMPIEMYGGAGDDTLKDAYNSGSGRVLDGEGGNDKIEGYAGDDTIAGGDGNDEVDGGEGNDKVSGGAGDDIMWGDHYKEPGADVLDGGPGVDTTQEWSIPEQLDRQPAVDVTLDGVANDGRPGEGDNVVGIEKLQLYVVGKLTGTDGPEELNIVNPGNRGPSTLIGRGGDDSLYGYDFDDTVDGGAGNDHVEGGLGNDSVTGGPGRDVIYGDATASRCTYYSCKISFGNDVINARDGEADTIDCGIGTDKAIVDAIDTVANCETVDAAGASGAGIGGGRPGGGNGAALAISVSKARLARLIAKGLPVSVACAGACKIDGTLTLRGKKVGGGHGTALRAGTAKATLRLNKAGKKTLKRLRSATLKVKVTMTAADGAKLSAAKTVTVKR
jgi:hypothetical protein